MSKNPCVSCKHRGDLFKLGGKGIPHCHCLHSSVKPEDYGWESLREGFYTCEYFERRINSKQSEVTK